MQDARTNRLETAESIEELHARIPRGERGPTFHVDEIVRIKGYFYRVTGLGPDHLSFAPHGKGRAGFSGDDDYRPRRKGQR